jgi:outer membrane protein assembly factor BamC
LNVTSENTTAQRAVSLAAGMALALGLAGCSSIEGMLTGDKLDYKSQAQRTATLEVPPDLTQLARDNRYQPQSGAVTASSLQQPGAGAATAAAVATVAPATLAGMSIERNGNQRWLRVKLAPEQVWGQLREFWQERGFNLAVDSPEAGVMETGWAENRAKIPMDGVRKLLGGVLDSLYDSGERDRFRTRVERSPEGTEIFITHRGMEEVLVGVNKDSSTWRPRANDPQLEAEMLTRLMVKLGARDDAARGLVAKAGQATAAGAPAGAAGPARARLLDGGSALEVDEAFDRAWRRVGLALDRSGFTVEDRDRNAGQYYVRYAEGGGKEEPGFFAKLFSNDKAGSGLQRYRVSVKANGDKCNVSVLDSQGNPAQGAVAQRIAGLLVDELR